MTRLILSTSNIMGGGPSVIRRPAFSFEKSNTEFTHSLQENLVAAQQAVTPDNEVNGTSKISFPRPTPYTEWTTREGSTLFIPSIDFTDSGLAEERPQYDITVKLFFLPNQPASCRCAQTRDAVDLVLKELHVASIDLLIISYPGIAFDAEDEAEDSNNQDTVAGVEEHALRADADPENVDTMIETWACLEELYDEGVIRRLGVSEFGTQRLSKFLSKARIRPSVDQINVRDCCVVPRPLIVYAKQQKIELLTHNDCTNILPRGTVRELLGQEESGAGVLADSGHDEGLKGEVEPQWVIKYTAVVKNRGVIENKGYFAVAELKDGS